MAANYVHTEYIYPDIQTLIPHGYPTRLHVLYIADENSSTASLIPSPSPHVST